MKFYKSNNKYLILRASLIAVAILFIPLQLFAQASNSPLIKLGRIWVSIPDNGTKSSVNFTNMSFFPNDYDIMGVRSGTGDAGTGFNIGMTNFQHPFVNPYESDTTKKYDTVAVFGLTDQTYIVNGIIDSAYTSYSRYGYTPYTVVNPNATQTVSVPAISDSKTKIDATKLTGGTYDQKITVTNQYIYGLEVTRKALAWSQNYNDNYIIYDLTFYNDTTKTHREYDSVYIQVTGNTASAQFSNGHNPTPASGDFSFDPSKTWQHYFGGRAEDTLKTFCNGTVPGNLRVFYEYPADDPDQGSENMGTPLVSQGGRLIGYLYHFMTILHASAQSYIDPSSDADDFLQPKITYMANDPSLPYSSSSDEYGSVGSSAFWAIRGAFSDLYPMGGNTFTGTHHGFNSDELGTPDFSNFPSGTRKSSSLMHMVFGPYNFPAGAKVHIVYAAGVAGIDEQTAKSVGAKWLNGTLQDPPNESSNPNWNATTGMFPQQFQFRQGSRTVDQIKDRWISLGLDSVMLSAYRAKWNYDHHYSIPQAPLPPTAIVDSAFGTGPSISWTDPAAESMPNFAGYRILKKITNTDTTFYQVIYDSDKNDKAFSPSTPHVFIDKNVIGLANYYYYIQAKAVIDPTDPNYANADPTTVGKILYSPRTAIPTIYPTNPPRQPQDDLSKIRIAPNPYNIKDPALVNYEITSNNPRVLMFFNLPVICTIQIFTENGDLIKTIYFNSPVNGGSYQWDMLSSNQQAISSGVYIAVFSKPGGGKSFQKFVVVR
jgi:hypothetical protein